MPIEWIKLSRWDSILDLMNVKRELAGFAIIEHTFENYVKQSDINTLRNGTVEILPTWNYTLDTALHDADYDYDTWKTWDKNWIAKRSLDEIEDILNLLSLVGIHCHNPEGKEINSIRGVSPQAVEIYEVKIEEGEEVEYFIGYGAHDTETHNQPFYLPIGNHTIRAKFNGMTLEKNIISESEEESQTIILTFPRIEWNVTSWITSLNSVGSVLAKPHGGGETKILDLPAKDMVLYAFSPGTMSGFAAVTVFVFTGLEFEADLFASGRAVAKIYHEYLRNGISVSLPDKSPYTNWYCQRYQTGYYPHMMSKMIGEEYWEWMMPGTTCTPSIGHIQFRYSEDPNGYKTLAGLGAPMHLPLSGTVQIKISSVPYDILGTAV